MNWDITFNMDTLLLDNFYYDLPDELIAHQPLSDRSQARLLIRQSNGDLIHDFIYHIPKFLPKDSLIVMNNSRVIPSRLEGTSVHGGRIEIFLLEPASMTSSHSSSWLAIGKPFRKLKVGTKILFDNQLTGKIIEHRPTRDGEIPRFLIEFTLSPIDFLSWVNENGYIPLPPYIKRDNPKRARDSEDKLRYQTVYAKDLGSVAAPTAGLHFSEALMKELDEKGIERAEVTLHVGAGTFMPVKTQNPADHTMHEESFFIMQKSMMQILAAKKSNRPIIAVGTTTLRTLESIFLLAGRNESKILEACDKWHKTSLFIYPKTKDFKYKPWCITHLMTNFHQPGSTLFMLISSLIGLDEAKALYLEAIEKRYRFFSYGDSTLLAL